MTTPNSPIDSQSSSVEGEPLIPPTHFPEEDQLRQEHDQDDDGQAAGQRPDTGIERYLYFSHFLSTWNVRVFEFAAILFLAKMFPGTLLPSSIYALVRAASAILLSPAIGAYIDKGRRLQVVRLSIMGQRVSVLLSGLLFGLLSTRKFQNNAYSYVLLFVLCLLAPVEKLCALMKTIAIERDWVVVIAERTSHNLEILNSQMRRIDLFCKLIGPLCIALIDGLSTRTAIIFIFATNVISVPVEYLATAWVYRRVPALEDVKNGNSLSEIGGENPGVVNRSCWHQIKRYHRGVGQYFRHDAFLPSLALSFLHFTVLSFSGQMVAFLSSVDYNSTQIGLMRTAAVVVELSATWLAPGLMNRIGPVRTGLWSINWQMLCLLLAVAYFWFIKDSQFAALAMVSGVIPSRLGLWGFDLSVQILVQESVSPESRGSFSSTEASFQNLFEMCAYLTTTILHRPDQFKYPMLFSTGAIVFAAALYAKYVRDTRGHLIHLSKCVIGKGRANNPYLQRDVSIRLQDLS